MHNSQHDGTLIYVQIVVYSFFISCIFWAALYKVSNKCTKVRGLIIIVTYRNFNEEISLNTCRYKVSRIIIFVTPIFERVTKKKK